MTALLDRTPTTEPATPTPPLWTIGTPRLLAGLDQLPMRELGAHLSVHGPVPGTDLDRLLAHLDGAGLTGRGGAGFPLARKIRALLAAGRGPRRVVINGSESEPASLKDRLLLRRAPHLVLDGALTLARAVAAREVIVAVHDEESARTVRAALAQRPDGPRVTVTPVSGRFVAGEARALVRGLDLGPALPPGRPEHLTTRGTLVANVETLAQLAILLRLGPRRFAETGTRDEPGTALVTIGGAVGRPGVVELPIGTPLGIVLTAAHAPAPEDISAVVTGGYHGSWVAPNGAITLSRAGLASAGASFGAGVLLVLDRHTCALGELGRVAGWLADQSARQCGPCAFGLPALAADVAALAAGQPTALGRAFGHARAVDGRGACHHPDGAARFVTSGLHLLVDEVERHRRGGCGRPVLGQLPIATGATR